MINDAGLSRNGGWKWANPHRKFVLSPEDLADDWTMCERCFYRRIRLGIPLPAANDGLASSLANMMSRHFAGRHTDAMGPDVPRGFYYATGHEYQSMPQVVPGHKWHLVIKGSMHGAIACQDGTYAVCLMRAGTPPPEDVPVLWRQLMAYARCLDNSIVDNYDGKRLTRLGLLIFEPRLFVMRCLDGRPINSFVGGELQWLEVKRDDLAFDKFLGEVLDVLESPESPEAGPNCEYCKFLGSVGGRGYEQGGYYGR